MRTLMLLLNKVIDEVALVSKRSN